MIKYLGSKRRLIPDILRLVGAMAKGERWTVLDLFSGTSRVGQALKGRGHLVHANDHNHYAHVLARCYVQADMRAVEKEARDWIGRLNRLPGKEGWFTRIYAREARFFKPENAARVEAIRNAIAEAELSSDLEAVLLVSLMEAADRVDSTTGVQMAYLKDWAPRAKNPLELRFPHVLPGEGFAHRMEAVEAARKIEADLAYLDPPYNQHSYLGNYHVWETLVLWDEPEVYGKARKRIDCRSRKSDFNSKVNICRTLEEVIRTSSVKHLIVSFNDEGYVKPEEIRDLLSMRGEVLAFPFHNPRYVGAKIGIYNPDGERVGTPRHQVNHEILFVATGDPEVLNRVKASRCSSTLY